MLEFESADELFEFTIVKFCNELLSTTKPFVNSFESTFTFSIITSGPFWPLLNTSRSKLLEFLIENKYPKPYSADNDIFGETKYSIPTNDRTPIFNPLRDAVDAGGDRAELDLLGRVTDDDRDGWRRPGSWCGGTSGARTQDGAARHVSGQTESRGTDHPSGARVAHAQRNGIVRTGFLGSHGLRCGARRDARRRRA